VWLGWQPSCAEPAVVFTTVAGGVLDRQQLAHPREGFLGRVLGALPLLVQLVTKPLSPFLNVVVAHVSRIDRTAHLHTTGLGEDFRRNIRRRAEHRRGS
jgi:hypothetical protein